MSQKYILLVNDVAGGDPRKIVLEQQLDQSWLILGVVNPEYPELDPLSVSGLQLSTLGVDDAPDKRFVTDAQLNALAALVPLEPYAQMLEYVAKQMVTESLLGVALVDMNLTDPQTVYQVSANAKVVFTKIVLRQCDGDLTTASVSFGVNTTDDILPDAPHPELTDAYPYVILPVNVGVQATGGQALSAKVNTPQGSAMSLTCEVFGYITNDPH